MNFVLSTVLFVILFMMVGMATTTVDTIQPDSPAMFAGMQPGDEVVRINEEAIKTWDQLVNKINSTEGVLTLEILRNGQTQFVEVTAKFDEASRRKLIGISPTNEKKLGGAIGAAFEQIYYLTKGILTF